MAKQPEDLKTIDMLANHVSAIYRNPLVFTETWTGRGRKPQWVLNWIAQGGDLDSLLIVNQSFEISGGCVEFKNPDLEVKPAAIPTLEKKKPGRKPKGEKAMTNAERMAKSRLLRMTSTVEFSRSDLLSLETALSFAIGSVSPNSDLSRDIQRLIEKVSKLIDR